MSSFNASRLGCVPSKTWRFAGWYERCHAVWHLANSSSTKAILESISAQLAVNDSALGSPEQSLRAYIQLRTARRIALNIERRGRPLTLAHRKD